MSADSIPESPVVVMTVRGTIDPVVMKYLSDGFEEAVRKSASGVVILLDTPGGLLDSTRDIIRQMLNAPFPVIVYVSPRGARAASAGVFITMASDVAAMAPETHMGAAHPVSIGGGFSLPGKKAGGEKKEPEPSGDVLAEKSLSDTVAYIRSIAASKGRNVEWAERAVRESRSVTAEEAVQQKIVDHLASDLDDLFGKIDGKTISKGGRPVTLHLRNAPRIGFEMNWIRQFLHQVANPNVAYLLLIIGFYGLIYEFATPGVGFGGAIGLVSLITASFSLQVLPISYAGLLLILSGLAMMFMELKIHTLGLLTVGGLISFSLGSILLFQSPEPYYRVSLELIAGTALATLGFISYAIRKVVQTRFLPTLTGPEGMIGLVGEARTALSPTGTVFIHGEYWTAESPEPVAPGESVVVTSIQGTRLHVKRFSEDTKNEEGKI